jgi:thiamine pyrophosphokinase
MRLCYKLHMILAQYLERFSTHNEVFVIGPNYQFQAYQEPVVFIDSGTAFRKAKEGFSIGDNDSYQGVLQEVLPKEKDISDLGATLAKIPTHFKTIHLLGFLDGRKDHELSNFFEVVSYLQQSKSPRRVVWDQGRTESLAWEKQEYYHQGVFSVFSFFAETKVSIEGNVKYPLHCELKPLSSHGLSNEAHGKFVIITNEPILILGLSESKTRV